ncbi:hypothetical protein QYM36_018707 [Artemia franciscana]|uniref:Uncharacterized protein n=1 Tax=Artemia franciscana TaxID=6661 RepID=A0AA88L047_ARTSF|nr:hypothetical protein QYM36_018707 [Artemia franciscana]
MVTPITVNSTPATDKASIPIQSQRAARGVPPARVYRDEEGKADKEPWERLSNRTSNDDVEQRNMRILKRAGCLVKALALNSISDLLAVGDRLDDRDNKRIGQMKPDGRDWNFQDSHQVLDGNIPPNIVESDLKHQLLYDMTKAILCYKRRKLIANEFAFDEIMKRPTQASLQVALVQIMVDFSVYC